MKSIHDKDWPAVLTIDAFKKVGCSFCEREDGDFECQNCQNTLRDPIPLKEIL